MRRERREDVEHCEKFFSADKRQAIAESNLQTNVLCVFHDFFPRAAKIAGERGEAIQALLQKRFVLARNNQARAIAQIAKQHVREQQPADMILVFDEARDILRALPRRTEHAQQNRDERDECAAREEPCEIHAPMMRLGFVRSDKGPDVDAGLEARGPYLQTFQGWTASLWLAFLCVLKGFLDSGSNLRFVRNEGRLGVGRVFDSGKARRLCAQIHVKRHAGLEARGPHLQTFQGWTASLWLAFLRVLKGFSGFRIAPFGASGMRGVWV
jgi:hypothetical protein